MSSEEATDEELLARCREGDRTAYAELYERYNDIAHRYATTLVRDSGRAHDLVSDAFMKIMALLDGGRGPESHFKPYLLAAIRNGMVSDFRRYRREDLVGDPTSVRRAGTATESYAESHAEATVVAKAFAALPERWREVLWATEVLGEPLETAAERFGIKANAAGVLSWRAREGFRQNYLAEHLAASSDPDCEKYAAQIPQYVRGQLAPVRAARLDEHLRTCEVCPQAVMDLHGINSNLGALLVPAVLVFGATGATSAGTASVVSAAPTGFPLKIAAATALTAGVAAVGAVLLMTHPSTVATTTTAGVVTGRAASPGPADRAPHRGTRPAPSPTAATSAPTSSATAAEPSAKTPTSKPAQASAPAVLLLDQPAISTTRTSRTTNVRVASSATSTGPTTVVIDVANATSVELLNGGGAWTCSEREVAGDSVEVSCAASSTGQRSIAVRFGIAVADVTQPLTGRMTLSDSRSEVSRSFDVGASPVPGR